MGKAKKFGTFSGVFTPSILTILGVIMYLRFPSIIGQAGLINTIGIIVIAHIISITTSLSMASLSTDKPVKNGGTYFMISRSLGLPIGGTLGLALFVGLSFSVSLYLIGFAESFLQYWNLDTDINSIRIAGTIVLLAVTTITFISTSLAIKSQYVIMVAIGLSLLSIFLGHHDFAPTSINLKPIATAAPFMLLFGIFFPAVTGFEAGVSMSGDLKDSRKSLPLGAILAVGVGFVVYIGLAFFFAFTVDANALANDPQILFKISAVPVLVIAGIWGATLSSALGSILGAPRILQAIAMDKIAPKLFAKGTGKTNEPRNALLLTFAIAEVGILIGDLDVIARIVSMFFITTYAFLNLASAIESWSSSDFRPAFKIPKFVSILGALSAFLVMILLDFVALAGATIVLGLLYFYLQRKELILESGDAWSSFWTNLAKRALLKLSVNKENKRNWRPNIILFSGGEKARPHLVEIGKAFSGKLGVLTDFNLSIGGKKIEDNNQIDELKNSSGFFVRHLECSSLKEGIKTVTNIYGFSGFEPNTVLMGWSKDNANYNFLSELLLDFKTKKMNAVFLDYDKIYGFRNKQAIDIWWNGKGRHLSFSLNILRFLLSDKSWRDSQVRILIISSDSLQEDNIYRNTNAILKDKRLVAEVKIISDDFGSRKIEEIIQTESADADLVLLGLSQKNKADTNKYIEKINEICNLQASILLLSPSTEFEEINIVDRPALKQTAITPVVDVELNQLPEIEIKLLKNKIEVLDNDLMRIGQEFCNQIINGVNQNLKIVTSNMQEFSSHIFKSLQKEFVDAEKHEYEKIIDKNQLSFLRNSLEIVLNKNSKNIEEGEVVLQKGIEALLVSLDNYIYESADSIAIPFVIQSKNKEKVLNVPFRKSVSYYIEVKIKSVLNEQFAIFEETSKVMLTELRNLVFDLNDKLEKLYAEPEGLTNKTITGFENVLDRFTLLKSKNEAAESNFVQTILNSFRDISVGLIDDLKTPDSLKRTKRKISSKTKNYNENLVTFADEWGAGMLLINNAFYLDVLVLSKKIIFRNIILKGNSRIATVVSDSLFSKQNNLIENLKAIIDNTKADIKPVLLTDQINLKDILNESYDKAMLLMGDLPEEFTIPEKIYDESEFIPFSEFNPVTVNLSKSANYNIDVLFHEQLYREIENLEVATKKAIVEAKEINSMLLFHKSNIQNVSADEYNTETDVSWFKKQLNQIEEENIIVDTTLGRINHYAESYLSEAFSRLFYHSVMVTGMNSKAGEREQKNRKIAHFLSDLSEQIKKQFNNSVIFVLNSTSSGILLSKELLEDKKDNEVQIKDILDLVDKITLDEKTFGSVPIFYRNLLSSSSRITNEFWIPREREMKAVKEALSRHKKGFGGAVFITGVHGAGKTTLTRYAVNHLFKSNNVIWLDTPTLGKNRPEDFLNELKKHAGGFDDFTGIFNNLAYESVIVINDLESWWERRPGGGQTIQQIIELIKLYGQKVFFIINCNSYSYSLMKQLFPINEYSLSTISCSAFNSQELQQMIIQRHKSSGINLTYSGKQEDAISQLTYSFLFNRYFHLSQGIPGVAINMWKANISSVGNDSIVIKKPESVNYSILYDLPKDWLVILAIFIQHKQIDMDKLVRITGMAKEKSADLLLALENNSLIVNENNNGYTLKRDIEPLIVEVCENKGLI